MKFRTLALGMGMLFVSNIAQAAPFLYTFEGTIESITLGGAAPVFSGSVDIGGDIFTIDETVSYVFNVDRTSQGFCTTTNALLGGCDFSETSSIPVISADYFFSELVSATYGNGGVVPFDWKMAELQWGLESNIDGVQLNGGSAITVFEQFAGFDIPLFSDQASFDADTTNYPVNFLTGLHSWDESLGANATEGNIRSTLSLSSITHAPHAIPTPTTLALFAAALLLLPFRKKNKQILSAQVA